LNFTVFWSPFTNKLGTQSDTCFKHPYLYPYPFSSAIPIPAPYPFFTSFRTHARYKWGGFGADFLGSDATLIPIPHKKKTEAPTYQASIAFQFNRGLPMNEPSLTLMLTPISAAGSTHPKLNWYKANERGGGAHRQNCEGKDEETTPRKDWLMNRGKPWARVAEQGVSNELPNLSCLNTQSFGFYLNSH